MLMTYDGTHHSQPKPVVFLAEKSRHRDSSPVGDLQLQYRAAESAAKWWTPVAQPGPSRHKAAGHFELALRTAEQQGEAWDGRCSVFKTVAQEVAGRTFFQERRRCHLQ
jgi:hypothetical protein